MWDSFSVCLQQTVINKLSEVPSSTSCRRRASAKARHSWPGMGQSEPLPCLRGPAVLLCTAYRLWMCLVACAVQPLATESPFHNNMLALYSLYLLQLDFRRLDVCFEAYTYRASYIHFATNEDLGHLSFSNTGSVLLLVVMTTPKQFDMVLRRLVALRVPKARAGKNGFWWLL